MLMRTVRSIGGRRWAQVSTGRIDFDEAGGYLARVSESVAQELVAGGIAEMPSPEELCAGRFLIRRRSGMGDVLCLSAAVAEVQRLGGECEVITHPNYRTVFDHWLAPAIQWQEPKRAVMFDTWLDRHPGRKGRAAAHCFGDWWNLDLDNVRPRFVLTDEDREAGHKLVAEWRQKTTHVVVLFLHAGWETRTYLEFQRVAKDLAGNGCAVVGFGDEILPCCKRPPQMGLRALAGLIAASDLVVCGDSGPMHLAAAIGTPVVAVFCASSAAGSIGDGYDVTALEPEGMYCWPCWSADCREGPLDAPGSCVRAVYPERVVEAAMERLRPRPEPQSERSLT